MKFHFEREIVMKKILLALLICVVMLLPLVACDGCGEGDDTTTEPVTTLPEPTPVDGFIALTRDGVTDFRVVIPYSYNRTMVKDTLDLLKNKFYTEAGTTLVVVYDNTEKGDNEIIVGATSRSETALVTEGMGARDWEIKMVEGHIVVGATSLYSTCLALDELSENLVLYEGNLYIDPEFSAKFCYETDNTEDVYGTLDEKRAQYGNPQGRPMFVAHRAENVISPENSRAALISAVAAGADMIEVDVQKTKDGHYVLMHDSTLTRTTNVAEFAGKKGYPSSHNVSDWTLEQIMDLKLLGSAVDEPVATLEEAFEVARGKCLLIFDKIKSDADTLAICRIAIEMRALDSVMFQYASTFNTYKTIYAESGIAMPYLHYIGKVADAAKFVEGGGYEDREYAMQAIQYDTSTTAPDAALVARVKAKCRLYVNTLGGSGYKADTESTWTGLYNVGVGIIQSDEVFRLASVVRQRTFGIGYSLDYGALSPAMEKSRAIVKLNSTAKGKIYYTLDGSDPTAESTEYTKNFVVSDTSTVRVLCVGNDGKEYRLDFEILAGSDLFYEMVEAAKAK